MTSLTLKTSAGRDGVVIVEVAGELDLFSSGALEEELRGIEAGRPPAIVIDLRPLAFIDSSGLRMLVSADARARELGCRFALVKGPARVQRVFQITGLDGRLELVEDPAQAP